MGIKKLILINDVETEQDKMGLIVGGRDVPATHDGLRDSINIAKHVIRCAEDVGCILSSDMARVSRVLHHLRVNVKYGTPCKISDRLRERDMGIFNCNNMQIVGGFQSDIFQHSRVCAEAGETVSQCSERVCGFIKEQVYKYEGTMIVLSHPLAANIAFNSFLRRSITDIHPFWLKKGSCAVLTTENALSPWFVFDTASNVLDGKQYSLKDIEDEFDQISDISSSATKEDN